MKIFLTLILAIGMVMPLSAQEMSKEEMKMMERWKEYSTPGKQHAYLKKFTGKWKATVKMWMKPGAPPSVEEHEMEGKLKFGGRYYVYKVQGTFMGMPFEGMNLTAYDKLNKKFISFWVDNMGTGIYLTEGQLDKTGKIRTETGIWDDAARGSKMKVKNVTTLLSPDKFRFDMYMDMEMKGKYYKSMEITYTKIK